MKMIYWLFAATIFVSSFLLFQIQPLMSKHILPWLGGGSAVWIAAMFFFMVALAVGYIYALGITRCQPKYQVSLHTVSVLVVAAVLAYHAGQWPSPVTPGDTSFPVDLEQPTKTVLLLLLWTIGLPFFLLSSTSTLIQEWYGRLAQREPVSLYAVSNVGSLAGLLSYPVFFEPWFSTLEQGRWWSWGFGLYVVLLLIVMHRFVVARQQQPITGIEELPNTTLTMSHWWSWLSLTAVPVVALLVGTSFITTIITVMPFLWVVPLALYLLSFVISFRPHIVPSRQIVSGVAVVGTIIGLTAMGFGRELPVMFQIVALLLALASVYYACHEQLYATRPLFSKLPMYYTAMALGGVVGSVVVLAITIWLTMFPLELALLLALVGVWAVWQVVQATQTRLADKGLTLDWPRRLTVSLLMSSIIGLALWYGGEHVRLGIFQTRNFFGYKSVADEVREGGVMRALNHGTTNHGGQWYTSAGLNLEPTTYYGPTSGIGRSMAVVRQTKEGSPIRVAVIGTGSGALAAYCRPGDEFVFFEIDPQVVTIAREYFSFLDNCQGAVVEVADGRLGLAALAKENVLPFDVIVVDAYADDLIPVHLVTAEAIALYRHLLSSRGILAVHISSRHLNLERVMAAYDEDGLHGRIFQDAPQAKPARYWPSVWTLFSEDQTMFDYELLKEGKPLIAKPLRWTDTYSALLPLLR